MGSFAAQQFVLDHSDSIDGLVLSGSGTLDGLVRFAQSLPAGEDPMKFMNAAFEPSRTRFDWLSRDNAEVDNFINDPLCFPSLRPESMKSFLDAFSRLASPRELQKVRDDLAVYIFSGTRTQSAKDWKACACWLIAIAARGLPHLHTISIPVAGTKCSTK